MNAQLRSPGETSLTDARDEVERAPGRGSEDGSMLRDGANGVAQVLGIDLEVNLIGCRVDVESGFVLEDMWIGDERLVGDDWVRGPEIAGGQGGSEED